MKKLLPLLCTVCLIFTSCSYEEVRPASGVDTEPEISSNPEISAEPENTDEAKEGTEPKTAVDTAETEPVPDETVGHLPGHKPVTDNTDAHFSLWDTEPKIGRELKIDIEKYSADAKMLTAEDIYLLSFNCGYLTDIGSSRLIIETEQQLDAAMREYGSMISNLLSETSEEYPIDGYSYVLEYVAVSTGGYDLKAGALLVDTDSLFFVQSADSVTPDPFSVQTTVMDGFCYMAVLSKGTLLNEHYGGWTYPESEASVR